MAEKAYRYRIYPTKQQEEMIKKNFDCCRFIYNYYLNKKIKLYETNKETFSYVQCANDMTKLKSESEYLWLKEADSVALQQSLRNLDSAFQNFFKQHTGYPKFKSKKNHRYSYRTKIVKEDLSAGGTYVKLPKIGEVKVANSINPEGRMLSVTVSQEASGRYYISICCTDVNIEPLDNTYNSIGIALGLKTYCVFSDREKELVSNPQYYEKAMPKMAKLQQELSRRQEGGSNYEKTRIKLAKLHEKIANQRKDFLQKLSTDIVEEYDTIYVEDFDFKKILMNESEERARMISDASFGDFIRMLEYKCGWYGKTLVRVPSQYDNISDYRTTHNAIVVLIDGEKIEK